MDRRREPLVRPRTAAVALALAALPGCSWMTSWYTDHRCVVDAEELTQMIAASPLMATPGEPRSAKSEALEDAMRMAGVAVSRHPNAVPVELLCDTVMDRSGKTRMRSVVVANVNAWRVSRLFDNDGRPLGSIAMTALDGYEPPQALGDHPDDVRSAPPPQSVVRAPGPSIPDPPTASAMAVAARTPQPPPPTDAPAPALETPDNVAVAVDDEHDPLLQAAINALGGGVADDASAGLEAHGDESWRVTAALADVPPPAAPPPALPPAPTPVNPVCGVLHPPGLRAAVTRALLCAGAKWKLLPPADGQPADWTMPSVIRLQGTAPDLWIMQLNSAYQLDFEPTP